MNYGFVFFLLSFTSLSFAAGGTGKYELDWDQKSEYLEYHSCGSADACWVAEVREKKNKKLKLKLRCDGGKLYARLGRDKKESQIADSCKEIECTEINCKPARIKAKAEELLGRSPLAK